VDDDWKGGGAVPSTWPALLHILQGPTSYLSELHPLLHHPVWCLVQAHFHIATFAPLHAHPFGAFSPASPYWRWGVLACLQSMLSREQVFSKEPGALRRHWSLGDVVAGC
jgi:hypothetical protein